MITTGDEFNPPYLSESTEPPRAPTSDVTSISKLFFFSYSPCINILTIITAKQTENGEKCKLPYRPQLDNSTETTAWNMSFCYKNTCPTENALEATCESGKYIFQMGAN
jgi:hypothetical protein